MKIQIAAALLSAAVAFGSAAHAHVHYLDLNVAPVLVNTEWSGTAIVDPCTGYSSGCDSRNDFTRFGWIKGTETTLGDSHYLTVNANFWKFHLATTASVTITFTASGTSASSLNPAFSVYSGLLPTDGHDDVTVDPLNPVNGSGCAIASPKDAHSLPWTYQVHDGYRDTLNFSTTGGVTQSPAGCNHPIHPYVGQFDAFASWSMANASGRWTKITYVSSVSATAFTGHDTSTAHVAGNTGTQETLTLSSLPAGDYTIAAGGESCTVAPPYSGACGSPRLYGTVKYTHTP